MRPTWKDAVATLVMAVNAGVYVAYLRGVDLPLISSTRGTTAAVLVLGILGGCALSETGELYEAGTRSMRIYAAITGLFGMVAFAAAVAGLISGSDIALAVLFAATVLLWLAATTRHLLISPSRVEKAGDVHERIDGEQVPR